MRIALVLAHLSALCCPVAALAQEVATFVPEHRLQWGKESAGSGARARAALIVTADRYASDPAWNLPSAKRSGELLRDALVQHAGLPRSAIAELSDKEVHAGAVEAAIQSVGKSIGADGAIKQGVLLVLWIGHGCNDEASKQQQLFTYYTQRSGKGYAPVISQAQMVAWLNQAHADAKARGVELTPVVVYDVCRPNVQLAPPSDAVAVRGRCWQAFGVSKGGYAEAKGDVANFSGALADALAIRAQTGSADLAAVFREAKDLTEKRTERAQVPELIPPEDQALARTPPPLVQPRRIAFTVRLADALSGGRVERAKVRWNDQEHDLTDARCVLAAAPGSQHQLEVRASGYLARAETLSLSDNEADRELVVPLLPHVTVLRARVTPPRTVQVRASVEGARAGYHVLDATTEQGEVELRLPAGGSTFRLQIVQAGRALQTLQVDNQPAGWLRDQSGRHTGIPLVQHALALDKAALDQLGAEAVPITIKDADAPKAQPQLADAFERAEWQAGQQNIAAEKWEQARRILLGIEGGGDVAKQWLRYVEARWARAGLERALADGRRAGDWSAADDVLAWWRGSATGAKPAVANPGVSNPDVANREEVARLVAEVERERVPLAVRKAYDQGNRAYAAGELEQAFTLYRQAEAQANAHYKKLITEQVDEIRARLYTRHFLAGNQHEVDGDKEKALQSYQLASRYSERARRHIERLQPDKPRPVATEPASAQKITTGIGLTMIHVQPQEFTMGSPASESGRDGDEQQHRVKITQGFWLGETEVTQEQWRQVMGTRPWQGKPHVIEGDEVAASYVSWNDAMEFCRKLTESERAAGRLPGGYRYILPTEAEWELACRAGSKTAFCCGDSADVLKQYAVFADSRSGEHAHAVKSRKANAWGFFDMHGNVWEWCLDACTWTDRVVTDTYRDGVVDPYNTSGPQRLIRGGSWLNSALLLRSSSRLSGGPGDVGYILGLRPALAARSDVK